MRYVKISRSTIYPTLTSFSVFPFLPLFQLLECLSRYMCGHNFRMNFPPDNNNNNNNNNVMQEKVARRCYTEKLSLKLLKICRKIPVLESLSNTFKGLQAIRLATSLKRNPTPVFWNQPFVTAL